jgi:hypothetical protein
MPASKFDGFFGEETLRSPFFANLLAAAKDVEALRPADAKEAEVIDMLTNLAGLMLRVPGELTNAHMAYRLALAEQVLRGPLMLYGEGHPAVASIRRMTKMLREGYGITQAEVAAQAQRAQAQQAQVGQGGGCLGAALLIAAGTGALLATWLVSRA